MDTTEEITRLKKENAALRARLTEAQELRDLSAQNTELRRQAAGWDIARASKDSAYLAEWKAADPEGFRVAWTQHLQAKMDAITGRGA